MFKETFVAKFTRNFLEKLAIDEHYITFVLACSSILLLSGYLSGLRTVVPLFLLLILSIYLKLKNLSFSAFLISIFSLQFFTPNKYYALEVIRGSELWLPEYKNGYWQGYGVNLANIFLFLAAFFVCREILIKKNGFIKDFKKVLLVFLSLFLFFFVALFSTLKHSPFMDFSLVWLAQYMQIIITSFLCVYHFLIRKKKFDLFFTIIWFSIFFQFILSVWQFLSQSAVGLPIESVRGTSFARGLDENNAVFRVAGSLLFHNQLGLISLIYLILYLPVAFKKQRKRDWLAVMAAMAVIVLTQSRSVWLAMFVVGILVFKKYQQQIKKLLNKIGLRRVMIYSLSIFAALSYVIVPRIMLSLNAPYEGAGIPIRIKLLKEGMEALIQNLWLGYGVGTNEITLFSMFPDGVMRVFPTVVHFALVQLTLEVGLIGVFFFIFPFFYILRKNINYLLQSGIKKQLNYFFTFALGILAFFIYYLFLPHIGIVEFAYLGIVLGFGLISLYDMD